MPRGNTYNSHSQCFLLLPELHQDGPGTEHAGHQGSVRWGLSLRMYCHLQQGSKACPPLSVTEALSALLSLSHSN